MAQDLASQYNPQIDSFAKQYVSFVDDLFTDQFMREFPGFDNARAALRPVFHAVCKKVFDRKLSEADADCYTGSEQRPAKNWG